MVIVFSNIDFIQDESKILSSLFNEGLERLHLKKLGTLEEWRNMLQEIPKQFHGKIVLHSKYELQKEFPDLLLHSGKAENSKGVFVSSSSHSLLEVESKIESFEYVFLSPIYTSLSKEKYSPKEDFDIQQINLKEKIVALGGIEPGRLMDLRLRGFNHIAILGFIWNQPEKAISRFKQIKKEWENLDQLF